MTKTKFLSAELKPAETLSSNPKYTAVRINDGEETPAKVRSLFHINISLDLEL